MRAGRISSEDGGSPLSPRLWWSTVEYRFRESLFQLPALIVIGGVVLAEAMGALDRAVGSEELPFTLTMNANAATWLLSTVAGATITTAGVVFSLTVVSLQLASSQFSPRVMRSFIRDRLSQVVIGLLVSTFVYCVLALRHIDGDPASLAPSLTMTGAVVLVVTTVLLIIAHLNHLAGRLQVGELVRGIFNEGERTLHEMVRQVKRERATDDLPSLDAPGAVVTATRGGWVTQAPGDQVLAAVPDGTTVRLETRTGAYIHRGEPLVTVWAPAGADMTVVTRKLRASVAVADVRTMQQDVDFSLRQLSDIGLRALSPAINDPTTAVEVVLRIGGLLREVLVNDLLSQAIRADGGRVLLRPWELSHAEYVEHAFDQLRQAAGSQTQVLAALLRVLRMLRQHVTEAGRGAHVPALQRQLNLLLDAIRTDPGLHPDDRERLLAVSDDHTDPAEHRMR